jgi:hypothetical protein
MTQPKRADLAAALADSAGSTRRVPDPAPQPQAATAVRTVAPTQPSRAGTVPITAHKPQEVRDQLKILAIERRKTVDDLLTEAINDLFAKYGKPEIAPRSQARAGGS